MKLLRRGSVGIVRTSTIPNLNIKHRERMRQRDGVEKHTTPATCQGSGVWSKNKMASESLR